VHDIEEEILALFRDGDRALITANVAELLRIFADDYTQYDESGKCSTKADVINNLQQRKIRYLSMISTGRRIRLITEDVAVVHGSEDDEIEQTGTRTRVRYVYTDVVIMREGKWQIVVSQLAKPATT
jgi:hypothetical protein